VDYLYVVVAVAIYGLVYYLFWQRRVGYGNIQQWFRKQLFNDRAKTPAAQTYYRFRHGGTKNTVKVASLLLALSNYFKKRTAGANYIQKWRNVSA